VSTVEKAKEVVADSRFPPVGRRGFGSPFTHGIWGVTTSEYLESANRDILVMVQIENGEAVENVHAIAAVDGIGQYFFIFESTLYN
jgi:4-hydroxy-2-oxoheptanedioate aldolase